MTEDKIEQNKAEIEQRLEVALMEIEAENERLRGEVAALELTGDRKELQTLLDQLGIDFEEMRERAHKAEAEIERLRALLSALVRSIEADTWHDDSYLEARNYLRALKGEK